MALYYASKSGTQNFTDTWAVINGDSVTALSSNVTEGSSSSYSAATTSWVASSSFTPGAITIDGIGVFIASTSLVGLAYQRANANFGTFSVRLGQAGSAVTGTTVTVDVVDLAKQTMQQQGSGGEYGEITDKIGGSWVFFKFASSVTLLAATAYTVDIIKSNSTGAVSVGVSAGTNWLRYLRTTSTGTPAATDRLFICGEITGSGAWSTNTVNHNSTDLSTTYGRVDVGAYGQWNWNNAASTNYYFKTSGDIRVGTLGQLQIGTSANPIPSTSTATIDFVSASGGGCTLHCARKSTLTMNGPTKTHYGYLRTNTIAGATTASVSTSTSSNVDPGWKNGDKVVFGAYDTTYNSNGFWSNYDIVTLTADSSNWAGASSTNLQWTTSTNNSGTSQSGNWYAHDTYLPWVANLTRNIVIKGASAANTCALTINTDQINMVGVEMYFCDGLYLRNGDGVTASLVKNCVVREGRSRAVDATGAGTGIVLRGCRNMTVEDCVAARGNGIIAVYGLTPQVITNRRGNLVKNCISIANHIGTYNCFGNAVASGWEDWDVLFDGCIANSNNLGFYVSKIGSNSYLGGNDSTIFKNCSFAISSGTGRVLGSVINNANWDNQQCGDGSRKLIIDSCTFYSMGIDVSWENIEFRDCSFIKRNPDLNYTQWVQNVTAVTYGQTYPTVFNNCTFNTTTSGGAQRLFAISYPCYWVVNGGSTNTNPTTTQPITFSNHGAKVVFNNFSCPNWGSAFPTTATTTNVNVSVNYSSTLSFQRFNQTEGDHRYYTHGYMSFSDSSVVDSSPRSLKVYSNLPGAGAKANPLRIPVKKNQSVTISAKVKMSEPGATGSNAFNGRIPSLFIRANRALGSSFNSDVETFASATAINGDVSTSGWTPASLGSTNLRLWLVADAANVTYNSTTKTVSQWNDLSGNNNHLTQSTDTKKPIFTVDSNHNGFSAVSLTREVDQRLVSSGNILSGNTSNVTIFMVAAFKYGLDQTNASTYGQFYSFNGASSRMSGWAAAQYSGNPSMLVSHVLDTDTATTNTEAPDYHAVPGMIQLFSLQNNNGSSYRRGYINGVRYNSQLNSDTVATVNITPTNFCLGVGKESTYSQSATMVNHSASVDIMEFIVVDKVMTATETADMNKYLANKYYVYLRGDKNSTTSWNTLSWTTPSVTDDTVIEASINIRAAVNRTQSTGFINIDSITVT